MLAASGGGSDWALELHLTPEWEDFGLMQTCWIGNNFNEVYNILLNMCRTLGEPFEGVEGVYNLYDIPIECNFTIDGERLTEVYYNSLFENSIDVVFGDYCQGTMGAEYIGLDRDLTPDIPF